MTIFNVSSNAQLTSACSNAFPGDEIIIANGTYTNPVIMMARSGAQGNPITVRAATVGGVTLFRDTGGATYTTPFSGSTPQPRTDITLVGLKFLNHAGTWISARGASHRMKFDRCTFSSENPPVSATFPQGQWDDIAQTYAASELRGEDVTFTRCFFPRWMGGDAVDCWGARALVEYCDLHVSGHGPIVLYGEKSIMQYCFIRNKWARGGHFAPQASNAGPVPDILIQYNIFYDCNFTGTNKDAPNEGFPITGSWAWSPQKPAGGAAPNAIGDGDPPGDVQMIKAGGGGIVYRFNLHLACNPSLYRVLDANGNPIDWASGYAYASIIQIGDYESTVYWDHGRFYHNAFIDNAFHGVAITRNTSKTTGRLNDNRFYNNVFHNNFNRSFYFNDTTLAAAQQYRNNIMTNPVQWGTTTVRDAAQLNAVGSSVASGNISSTPIFTDSNYNASKITTSTPTQAQIDTALAVENRPTLAQFALAPNSPGRVQPGTIGRHLTHLTVAANNTPTITVEDAYFFTDGNGRIAADRIIIGVGGPSYLIQSINKATTTHTITVVGNVTAPVNTPIFLEVTGSTPAIGLIPSVSVTPTPPSAPVLAHAEKISTAVGNVITSPTFGASIPANSLLIVCATANGSTAGVSSLDAELTASSGFLSGVVWEKITRAYGGTGSTVSIAVWIGRVGATPGEGTTTVTWSNNPGNKALNTMIIAEGFATLPIAQYITAGFASAPTLTATLLADPAADGLVIGLLGARGTRDASSNIIADSDAIELEETPVGTNHAQHIQYIRGGAGNTIDWSGTVGANGNAIIVLEIKAGVAEPAREGSGIGSFAAFTADGDAQADPPIIEGDGTGSFAALTGAGLGAHALPDSIVGDGTGIFAALTGAGTGIYLTRHIGTGQPSFSVLTATSEAEHVPPLHDASGAPEFAAFTGEAIGEYTLPEFGALASGTFAALTGLGGGVYLGEGEQENIGQGVGIFGVLFGTGLATFGIDERTGEASGSFAALTATVTGKYSEQIIVRFVVRAKVKI